MSQFTRAQRRALEMGLDPYEEDAIYRERLLVESAISAASQQPRYTGPHRDLDEVDAGEFGPSISPERAYAMDEEARL